MKFWEREIEQMLGQTVKIPREPVWIHVYVTDDGGCSFASSTLRISRVK